MKTLLSETRVILKDPDKNESIFCFSNTESISTTGETRYESFVETLATGETRSHEFSFPIRRIYLKTTQPLKIEIGQEGTPDDVIYVSSSLLISLQEPSRYLVSITNQSASQTATVEVLVSEN